MEVFNECKSANSVVFKVAEVEFCFDRKRKVLIQTWVGYVPSADFRKAIDFTVDFVKQNKVAAILSDTLRQSAIRPDDSEYAAAVMPKLIGIGLQAMAFVIPEDIFTKLSLKRFAETERTDSIEYFTDSSEANCWIDFMMK